MAFGPEIATAYVRIRPTAPGFEATVTKDVTKSAKTSGKKFAGLFSKTVTKIIAAAGGIFAGLQFLKGGISRLVGLEDAEARLKSMGLSGKQTDKLMAGLLKTLKGTAFALDEGAAVMAQLVTSGQGLNQVSKTMDLIADTAAFAKVPLADIGFIFGDIQTQGRLTGDSLFSLQSRGIPALELLADAAGVSSGEMKKLVSEGQVSADDFFKLWADGSKGFGKDSIKIAGSAKSMGDTTSGAFANMRTALSRLAANLLGGFFPAAKGTFNNVTTIVDDFGEKAVPVVERFAKFVTEDVVPALISFGQSIGPYVTIAFNALKIAIKGLLVLFSGLITGLAFAGNAFSKFVDRFPIAEKILKGIAAIIVGLLIPNVIRWGIVSTINAAKVAASFVIAQAGAAGAALKSGASILFMVGRWAFLGAQSLLHAGKVAAAWLIALGPIGLITAAVIAITVLIVKNWDTISRVTKQLWEGIKNFTSSAWESITSTISDLIASVVKIWQNGWTFVKDFLVLVWQAIHKTITESTFFKVFKFLVTEIGLIWAALWKAALKLVTGIWNGITKLVKAEFEFVKKFIEATLRVISSVWEKVWGGISKFFEKVWDFVFSHVKKRFNAVKDLIESILNALKRLWEKIWGSISKYLSDRWDAIRKKASDSMGTLKKGISDTLESIRKTWRDIWDKVHGKATDIWDKLVRGARRMRDSVAGAFDNLKRLLGNPINWVINNVLNKLIGGWNTLNNLWSGQNLSTIPSIRFATGGPVNPNVVPGVGNKDTVPALLTPGEYVMRKDAVRQLGTSYLDQLNSGHREVEADRLGFKKGGLVHKLVQKFQTGGLVGPIVQAAQLVKQLGYNIHSGFRQGSRTRSGSLSNHARGWAIDVSPSMALFNILRSTYPSATELIFTPAGRRQLWHGMSHIYSAGTARDHYSHIHLALATGIRAAIGRIVAFTRAAAKKLAQSQIGKVLGKITSGISGAVSNFIPGKGLLGEMVSGIFKVASKNIKDAAIKKLTDFFFSTGGGAAGPAGSGPVTSQVRSVAASYGWDAGTQWNSLSRLISKESGWRPTAQNPTSSAYGLFQFLNSTWSGTGVSKTSNPRLQAVAGLRYIKSRYGTPNRALAFHNRNNWYDNGGLIPPGFSTSINNTGKPEVAAAEGMIYNEVISAIRDSSGSSLNPGDSIMISVPGLGVVLEGFVDGRISASQKRQIISMRK